MLNKDKIQKLFEVGLDEIRLHTFRESKIKLLKYAKELGISIGLEYPAYPSYRKYIVNAIKLADKLGMDFVNINEFEVTDSTLTWAVRNGLIVSNTGVTVKGSEHFAKFILGWSIRNTKNISVHYCPFWVKDTIQYKNRLKIRAKSIKKSYERITHDGLLLKGCLIPKDNNVINSEIISEIKNLPGILEVLVEVKEGIFTVGEPIMAVAVAGDFREHVFPALEKLINSIKTKAVKKQEEIKGGKDGQ